MAFTILNNTAIQLTLGELNKNISQVGKALAKISSGQRINSSKDDTAQFCISEKMRELIRSLQQDIENSQTGMNLVKVAEEAIADIVDNLRYMKEMAINSANDTNTDLDRATIQKEFNQRISTINDIADTTNYNGRILLDGTYWLKKIPERKIREIIPSDPENNTSSVSNNNTNSNSNSISSITISGSTTNLTFNNSEYALTNNTITGLFPDAVNQYLGTASSYTPYSGLTGYSPEYYKIPRVVNPPVPNTGNLDVYKFSQPYLQYNSGTYLYYNYSYNEFQNLPVGTVVATWPIVGSGDDYHTGQVVVMPGSVTNQKVVENFDDNELRLVEANIEDMIKKRTAVEVDFSRAFANAQNENSSATWESAFHGQGFTILQSQIHDYNVNVSEYDYINRRYVTGTAEGTLISVVFDATQAAGTGTLLSEEPIRMTRVYPNDMERTVRDMVHAKTTLNQSAFVVGIKGVDSADQLGQAILDGLKNATGSWEELSQEINGDNTQAVRIQGWQDIEFQRTGVGRFILQTYNPGEMATPTPRIILYNGVLGISGNIAELPDSSESPEPSDPPEQPDSPDPSGQSYEYIEYKEIGNPLRIHHGPKANINLAVHINNMHTKALGTSNLINSTKTVYDEGYFTNESDEERYFALSYDQKMQGAWLETLKAAQNKNLNEIDVKTQFNANVAIRVLEGAIEYALNENIRMGAYNQRLEKIYDNLVVEHENVTGAESTIRDANMAKEMTEYTKSNVLAQVAQAVLAQANQNSSSVLSLLQ